MRVARGVAALPPAYLEVEPGSSGSTARESRKHVSRVLVREEAGSQSRL